MSTPPPRRPYPTDLTDQQWAMIETWVRRAGGPGAPTQLDLREVVNALRYMNRTGCAWRLLPHEFPNHRSVRYYFDKWTWDGTFARINRSLVEQARVQAGRDPQPTLAIVDSQTVKTTSVGGERGFDGGKKHPRAQASTPGRRAG